MTKLERSLRAAAAHLGRAVAALSKASECRWCEKQRVRPMIHDCEQMILEVSEMADGEELEGRS